MLIRTGHIGLKNNVSHRLVKLNAKSLVPMEELEKGPKELKRFATP